MIALLHRRIFLEISSLFCLSSCALLTLVLISRAVQMREMLLGLDIGLTDMASLFACMTPVFLLLVIPVSCMLSVFLTFLRMSSDREFIALRAGGVSILQMLPGPLLFSLICTGLTLWVSLHWIAAGMSEFRESLLNIATTRARIVVQPGVFNTDFPGFVLFSRQVNPSTGHLSQVLVEDRTQKDRRIIILANTGLFDTDSDRGTLLFKLTGGKIYSSGRGGSSVLQFEEYAVRLPLDTLLHHFDFGEIRPREMSWSKLASITREEALQRDENYANKIEVERHKRWAYPAACLALTVFVLPLAAVFEGIKRQTGLAIALVMFFVYYSLMSLGFSTGESGSVPPAIGLWFPNILFLTAGIIGLRLAERERMPKIHLRLPFGKNRRHAS